MMLLLMEEAYGWRKVARGPLTIWLKGCLLGRSAESIAVEAAVWPTIPSEDTLKRWLLGFDGHFALVVVAPGWTLCAVDCVRSIRLAYAHGEHGWVVGSNAAEVRAGAGLKPEDVDDDAVLALAMAGFTIDRQTLHRGLQQLGPGEFVLFDKSAGARPRRDRYHLYAPWNVEEEPASLLQSRLRETTLRVVDKAFSTLAGRTAALPLSAGHDSRLIASAAHHLGYRDVICFSYGQPGNHEAAAARQIAERLGYSWTFVPSTLARQRRFFGSETWRAFKAYSDDDIAVPFVQDATAIIDLRRDGYLPEDCVFINGNSGDFISGNHIPDTLRTPAAGWVADERRQRVIDALLAKHFGQWGFLATSANRVRIGALLWDAIEAAGGRLGSPETDHGLYEYSEFVDRQSKYVIKGQRCYEFLGHEWRMPLWDRDYLDFWARVPLLEKAGQSLYSRMLREENWGGVWHDIPVNRRHISPGWIIPIRLAAKLIHAPLGQAAWHRFERRAFAYWMDGLGTAAIVPYGTVLRGRGKPKGSMSWFAKDYLAMHGINLDRCELR